MTTIHPTTWLGYREEWLADPDSVRLQETDGGCWDIVLRIDGTYIDKQMAQDFAVEYQQDVHGLAEQYRRNPDLWMAYEDEVECPACGKTSILAKRLDRYLHCDGTDNQPCWVAITRGEVATP